MTQFKDWICMTLAGGLIMLLVVIVIGDFYVALHENRPVDESVINLLQMAVTGVIGIVAGYLSGKSKSDKSED